MSRKQKLLLAALAAGLAAAILLIGWLMGHVSGRTAGPAPASAAPSAAAPKSRRHAPAKPDPALLDGSPERLCEQAAPRAAKAYVTDSPQRRRLLRAYFKPDAKGLETPVSRILPQPAKTFTGAMNTGEARQHAVCSVYTGLKSSPWMLEFDWADGHGWQGTSIEGPIDGAYRYGA